MRKIGWTSDTLTQAENILVKMLHDLRDADFTTDLTIWGTNRLKDAAYEWSNKTGVAITGLYISVPK